MRFTLTFLSQLGNSHISQPPATSAVISSLSHWPHTGSRTVMNIWKISPPLRSFFPGYYFWHVKISEKISWLLHVLLFLLLLFVSLNIILSSISSFFNHNYHPRHSYFLLLIISICILYNTVGLIMIYLYIIYFLYIILTVFLFCIWRDGDMAQLIKTRITTKNICTVHREQKATWGAFFSVNHVGWALAVSLGLSGSVVSA